MPPDNRIGNPFFELSEVDSTNNYAMQMLHTQMAEHGSTWFAHYQNSGKGQRGKAWKADPGQNITMSVIIRPEDFTIDNQFILNATIALAIQQFFNHYTLGDTTIKWPNDIYWKDRKAGGILIENVIQGNKWKHAIVGVGININQTSFPKDIINAVSLRQITGKSYDVITLAKQLCGYLQQWWIKIYSNPLYNMVAAYNELLYKKNEIVTLEIEGEIYDVTIEKITTAGKLVVTHKDDKWILNTGNVKWILSK